MEKGNCSTDDAGTPGYLYIKHNLNSYFKPYVEINSEWIVDLNVKPKIKRLLEGNIGENLCDLG